MAKLEKERRYRVYQIEYNSCYSRSEQRFGAEAEERFYLWIFNTDLKKDRWMVSEREKKIWFYTFAACFIYLLLVTSISLTSHAIFPQDIPSD